jgi:hypothetical protein
MSISNYKHFQTLQIHETKGELKQALSDFVFAQKRHECELIHFGELGSQDVWEAAWMASRMFISSTNNLAIWNKDYAYNNSNVFYNNTCLTQFCFGSILKIDFGNRDDVALQIQYAKHIPKKGYSINFFAYNPQAEKLQKAFGEVLASVKTYRKTHPKGGPVQLILFTNDQNYANEEGYFDRIVGIKDEFMFNNPRQWTTRVIYSSFAPARISLFVDADSWSCREMLSFFEFMDAHEFDFTINAHWPHDMIIPDCGVYAWKWTEASRKLMAQWFDEFGNSLSGDDQGRLRGALTKLKAEVTIGRTRNTHAGRFAPGEGEGNLIFFLFRKFRYISAAANLQSSGWGPKRSHQQTMILHGPVHIIHAREAKPDVCDVLNQHSDKKRVFVCRSDFNFNNNLTDDEKADKLKACLHPVFNQTACKAELDDKCFYTNDWNADPDIIIRAPDFYVPPVSGEKTRVTP